MKILAIEKDIDGIAEDQFKPLLKDEARKIWELIQAGIIREIYFTKDDNCAVIMLKCSSKEEAVKILSMLPLVKEKLISFDIKPLVPYNGFARLF